MHGSVKGIPSMLALLLTASSVCANEHSYKQCLKLQMSVYMHFFDEDKK